MKKTFLILIVFICMLTACGKEVKTAIFLGKEPIDVENFSYVNRQPVFKQWQKIYYILVSKESIESPKLRLQILRLDMKHPYYKIEPAYGIDINRGEQKHYVTDYFILHKTGTYVIRIFSHDNLDVPIAETEFLVEAL